jgi:solute:Na+ symporter, SSS family
MGSLDWAVLVAYLLIVAGVGVAVGGGQKDSDDFLLGGRAIPWWAALLSLVATEISAATFLGAPEQGYLRNLTYLQFSIGSIAAKFFLAYYFITVYYNAGVTTVYEFLRRRFGPVTEKTTAGLFLIGRLLADGSRLFIAAITIEVITGFPINQSILLLAFVTILYTAAGGIKAVIWTDVLQAVVLVGAGVALFGSLWNQTGMSAEAVYTQLQTAGKLQLFDTAGNPFTDPYNVYAAIIGGFFLTMATHGTDHDMVQRLLTCKDGAGSRRSTWMSGLVGVVITTLFMGIGLMLYVHLSQLSADSDLALKAAELESQGKNGHYLLYYTLDALPTGVVGLIVAGVLAAAMSSLSSAFNAMTATFISDFYRPLRPDLSAQKELRASRVVTLLFGASVAGLALLVSDFYHSNPELDLLSVALGVMGFVYGGLLGIFLVALFTKDRGTEWGNFVAAVVSSVVVFVVWYFKLVAWPWFIVIGTFLSTSISLCSGRTSPKTRTDGYHLKDSQESEST